MKELSIEEKAKAYDGNYKTYTELINRLEGVKDAIKKQNYGIAMDILCKPYPEYQIITSTELEESEDERMRNAAINACKYMVDNFENSTKQYEDAIAWLEKQGNLAISWNANTEENKPPVSHSVLMKTTHGIAEGEYKGERWFQYRWASSIKDSDVLSWIELSDLEKQGEQKYMPKYKIGDYVKNTNYKGEPIYEIIYMDKECYICEYRGKERMGDKAVMHFSFDNPYLRLVQKSADEVEPKFKVGDTIKPKDGGHEPWQIMQVDISDKKYRFADGYVIHFSQEEDYELVEQKPTWSEEDEVIVNSIISFCDFKVNIELHNEEVKNASKNILSWLNKLKYRVQPKQVWSEEDEETLKDIITSMTNLKDSATSDALRDIYNSKIDWLKSLKPNHWKPSDKQMRVLANACDGKILNLDYLNSLYQDLKKLREE